MSFGVHPHLDQLVKDGRRQVRAPAFSAEKGRFTHSPSKAPKAQPCSPTRTGFGAGAQQPAHQLHQSSPPEGRHEVMVEDEGSAPDARLSITLVVSNKTRRTIPPKTGPSSAIFDRFEARPRLGRQRRTWRGTGGWVYVDSAPQTSSRRTAADWGTSRARGRAPRSVAGVADSRPPDLGGAKPGRPKPKAEPSAQRPLRRGNRAGGQDHPPRSPGS